MFCPQCGKESNPQVNFCSSCGAAATVLFGDSGVRPRLVRPRHPRMIAGVCSGFAIHYGWDVAVVRIVFAVLTCLTSGLGVLVYLGAWVVIPEAQYALPPAVQRGARKTEVRQNQAV